MRYADDIIVGFATRQDAEWYLAELPRRLAKFNLRLAGEKSALVKFNKWEPRGTGKFTFLGFDFYWAPTRNNPRYRVVKRKTCKKKYRNSLRAMKQWLKKSRSWPLKMKIPRPRVGGALERPSASKRDAPCLIVDPCAMESSAPPTG